MNEQKKGAIVADSTAKIAELMAAGKSLEEALQEILPKAVEVATATTHRAKIDDRVSWISEISTLPELRKALKIAAAKKSKSKDSPTSAAKHQAEIDAGNARLNEIIKTINTADDPIAKMIEYHETSSAVVSAFCEHFEQDLEDKVAAGVKSLGWTKSKYKEWQKAQSGLGVHPYVLKNLGKYGDEYVEEFKARAEKGDIRVQTMNIRLSFLSKVRHHKAKIHTTATTETVEAPATTETVEAQ